MCCRNHCHGLPISGQDPPFNIEKPIRRTSFDHQNEQGLFLVAIVAPREKWADLRRLMQNASEMLLPYDLMDDDQTLLLMAYRGNAPVCSKRTL
jgi:hypothetical protein